MNLNLKKGKMKNLLKDKKLIIGGAIVLGLVAFYYNKGKKVLAIQTPTSYSNADGVLEDNSNASKLSALKLSALAMSLNEGGSRTFGFATPINTSINSATDKMSAMQGLNVSTSRIDILKDTMAQFQANASQHPNNLTLNTPIVTSGIKVLPSGVLKPVGLNGVVTTIQTGVLGYIPKQTVKKIQNEVSKKLVREK